MKRTLMILVALIMMISGNAFGQATINRSDIPTVTEFYMPIGDKGVSIENDLVWGLGPDQIHNTWLFPGDYYDSQGTLHHGWYSYTNFNSNTIYTGGCYDGSLPNCGDYHTGEDWNGNGGSNTELDQPVYSIAIGRVIYTQLSSSGFGNMIQIVHNLPSGEYVLSFYAHLDQILVNEGDLVYLTTQIGTVGNSGTTPVHLHWEVRQESFLDLTVPSVVSLKNSSPYTPNAWPGTDTAFITNNYYAPSDFITGHLQIGYFADGEYDKDFLDAFKRFSDGPSLGVPWDNDHDPNNPNGMFVHEFYGMYIQDFKGFNNGLDHPYSSLIKSPDGTNIVYLLKEGFWSKWMQAGWVKYGYPTSDEQAKTDFFPSSTQPDYTVAQRFEKNDGTVTYLLWGETANPIIKAVDSNGVDLPTNEVTIDDSKTLAKSFVDGVYHTGIKISDFSVPFELINGQTYNGFYAVLGGEQVFINEFTVNDDMTITLGGVTQPNSYVIELNTLPSILTVGEYFQVNVLMKGWLGEFINNFRIALLDMSGAHVQTIYGPASVDLSYGFAGAYACMQGSLGMYQVAVQYSMDSGVTWSNFGDDSVAINPLTITVTSDSLPGPCIVNSSMSANTVVEIFVSGDYAYLACDREGMEIVNISDPTSPVTVGSVSEHARGIFVFGDHAYLATGQEGVKVIDISDPTSPVTVGSVDTESANEIFVAGNYAYLADGVAGMKIIDISDPTSPVTVGSVDTDNPLRKIFVAGNYAYLADGVAGMKIIDISDPTNPVTVGSVDTESANEIFVAGNYAYVADGWMGMSGVKVIDISDPSDPIPVGSVDTFEAVGIFVAGNYAYVADHTTMKTVDISDPTNPVIVGSVNADSAGEIFVSGNYAYLVDYWLGTMIIQRHCDVDLSANFTADPVSGYAPLPVQFTDQSISASSWYWDFGDGTNSTEQNPIHNYTTVGTYTVSLTVGNGFSFDVKTITDMIVVQDPLSGVQDMPYVFALSTNHPNPFNPTTIIDYQLDASGPVKLEIYDLGGRKVATLVDKILDQGNYQIRFDGRGLSSGVYFCRLVSVGRIQTRKMTLLK